MKRCAWLILALLVSPLMAESLSQEQVIAQQNRAALPALQEGNQFKVINPAGHTEVPTVVEVFSYGCPHCYEFESFMHDWLKSKPGNVKLERVPAVGMQAAWDIYAKVYYTAEALKILDKTHSPLFNQIHVEHKTMRNDDDAVSFLTKFGPDANTVRETMNGFYVTMKMNYAKEYSRKHKIAGVPGWVINDKYFTDYPQTKDKAVLEKVLSELPLQK